MKKQKIQERKYYYIKYNRGTKNIFNIGNFYEYIRKVDYKNDMYDSDLINLKNYKFYPMSSCQNTGKISSIISVKEITKDEFENARILCVI